MTQRPHIVVFAASNSASSINLQLAQYAAEVLQNDLRAAVNVEVLDLNDFEMPIYSPQREDAAGIPQLAHDFLAKIGAADGLIMSFAEHNGMYTAAFKNIFDWISRIQMKVFQDTPALVMATSTGRRGGQNVLSVALDHLPRFGTKIAARFSLPSFNEQFDAETGMLTSPQMAKDLTDAVDAFWDVVKPGQDG